MHDVTSSPAGDALARIHVPVMCERIVELFAPALSGPGAIYVDGTLGMAGHALAMLEAYPSARVIGIDQDPDALKVAQRRLASRASRVEFHQANFAELGDVVDGERVDAILLDLGLSSLQIDRTERGFSYANDAPLDMRMSPNASLSAADVVNTYPAAHLTRILREYGEERFADRIVKAIVERRETAMFERSSDLVDVISSAIPAAARHSGGHPAKRTFQALRIEVNRELEVLADVLPAALDRVQVGGRVAVLAYHSLEDRQVKHVFRDACSDHVPAGVPVVPEGYQATFQSITRGAERPSQAEVSANPRAASARLRVVERVREETP